ncbi:hypothetical protein LU699_07240 [Luteimonas fraxinea]|uniref:GNAT family N-acetyltransferase n=1 Tax=Luteimonas fraxinea TaxID=2901869 RepID=A0ABS8UDZ7_9GAMM|nr:hypothetical protein [Luteimonas fraxinea]MCD9097222.1 hypothetical protein [Luteimonas fraxinea]MCD9125213.1 hypothetical protein [Luteimonas fraxinea]UHH11488.1 hypothetical protein LU699_07240 [Luteimonas fraxinea]
MTSAALTLRAVGCDDADLLFRLMQYYFFEASAWSGERIGADGLFDCRRADVAAAIEDDPHWARLLECEGEVAGFVLVEPLALDDADAAPMHACLQAFAPGATCGPMELADLFVLPAWRRRGLALETVRRLLVPGIGPWLIATFREDAAAHAYWTRTLPRSGLRHEALPDGIDARFRLFAVEAPTD